MKCREYLILSDTYTNAKRTARQCGIEEGYSTVPFLLKRGGSITVRDGDILPISHSILDRTNYTSTYWLGAFKHLPCENFVEITKENTSLVNLFEQMCTEYIHSQKRASNLREIVKDLKTDNLRFHDFCNEANLQAEVARGNYMEREIGKLSHRLKMEARLRNVKSEETKEDTVVEELEPIL